MLHLRFDSNSVDEIKNHGTIVSMSIETVGYNRDTLLAMLHSRVVEVRYRKVDDEIRVLHGTLKEDLLPAAKKGKTVKLKESHSNLITLWDLDVEGWRSIRTDRIIDVL